MRIWYLSPSALGVDLKWSPYERSLKRHVQEVARPDTEVEVHGTEFKAHPAQDSRYARYLRSGHIINNAITAEREGYDAFCVGCASDPGLLEIKEVIAIPVAFLSESCFHLACLLADRFSLLALGRAALLRQQKMIKQYGLEESYVAGAAVKLSRSDLPDGFENPVPIIDAVTQASRSAIENGAGILLSGCNILNMVLVDGGLKEINGVPILDTAGALVKIAELMVDLKQIGISRSRVGLNQSLSKEDLLSLRKSCGLE